MSLQGVYGPSHGNPLSDQQYEYCLRLGQYYYLAKLGKAHPVLLLLGEYSILAFLRTLF